MLDILAWINSDDCYRPGALEQVARFFSGRPSVVFGNGDVNCINVDGYHRLRFYAVCPNKFLTANLGIHGWPQRVVFGDGGPMNRSGELIRACSSVWIEICLFV